MTLQSLSQRKLWRFHAVSAFVMVLASLIFFHVPLWAADPTCTVQVSGYQLNLRKSPGTGAARIGQLGKGEVVQPLAIVESSRDKSNPRWLQIKLKNGTVGWISANKEFVACSIDLSTLPKRSLPVVMSTSVSLNPVVLSVEGVGSSEITGSLRGTGVQIGSDNPIEFREFMEVQVDVKASGKQKGDGIGEVHFVVADENGTVIYETTEKSGPYCLFSNNSDNCTKVWHFSQSNNKWPKKQVEIDPEALYTLKIDVTANTKAVRSWQFQFRLVE